MPDAGSRAAVALRIGSNLDRAPTVISKIQIDPTVMLPDAEVNGQSGGVKLSPAGRLRRAQTPLRALGIAITFGWALQLPLVVRGERGRASLG
jgi:hypothetical protein